MKVLHVTPWFYPAYVYGGPTRSVYALCRQLSLGGCEVRVLTTHANGANAVLDTPTDREVELQDNVRVLYCRRRGSTDVSPQLLRHLAPDMRWADVVHLTAVYSFPTIPTLALARLMNKPLVWSPRGALTSYEHRTRRRLKRCWELVCSGSRPRRTVLHATSEAEARDCRDRLPGCDVAVVPNGVDAGSIVADPGSSRFLRILFLGRLHPMKGIENLIDACAAVAARGLDFRLTVAGGGDPEYVRKLSARAAAAGIERQVCLPGELREAARDAALADADVLVLPSHSENFGNVIAEALACGVPVIASRATPWARVEERGCGLWVKNDPASLADAIGRIARLPLKEMGAKGRLWMLADFDWPSVAREMLRVYCAANGTAPQPGEATEVNRTAAA